MLGGGCGGGGGGDGDEGGGDGGTFWNWFAPGQSFSWTQLILPRFMRLALNDLSCEILLILAFVLDILIECQQRFWLKILPSYWNLRWHSYQGHADVNRSSKKKT